MDFKRLLLVTDPKDISEYLSLADTFAGSAGNKALVEIIVRFMTSQDVVKKALFVFLKLFVSGHGIDINALIESNAVEAIIVDMHFHASDQKIQERGFRVFAYFASQSPEMCTALLNCGIMEHASTVFRTFSSNKNICKYGLSAISKILTKGNDPQSHFSSADLIDSIAVIISNFYSDSEIQSAGFTALYVIAGLVSAYADIMMSMGLGEKAFEAMKMFGSTPSLVHPALVFVSRLSRGDTAAAQFPKWCDLDALLNIARTYDDFREDSLVTMAAAATLDPLGRLLQNGGVNYIFDTVGQWSHMQRDRVPKGLKAISILTDSAKYAKVIGRSDAWLGLLTEMFGIVSDADTLNMLSTIMCNISFNDYSVQMSMFKHKTTHAIIRAAERSPTDSKALIFAALGNACGDCVENRIAAIKYGGVKAIEDSYAINPPVKEIHESAARALEVIFSSDEVHPECLTVGLLRKVEESQKLYTSSQMISNSYASLKRECDHRISCAIQTGVCSSALVPRCPSLCPSRKGCYCPACCVPQLTFFCVTCYLETGEVVRLCQPCAGHHDGTHTFIKSFVSRRCTCDLTECKVQKKKPRMIHNNNF